MSLQGGLSALRMEMPERIPRTEYSAHFHWELVKKVTGIDVGSRSAEAVKEKASRGYIMAVGNHIPANTPVENALWYNEFYEKYSRR